LNGFEKKKIKRQAYRDVLETLRWHKFAILYADNEGLYRVQEILKLKPPGDKELKLTIRQLVKDGDNRSGSNLLVENISILFSSYFSSHIDFLEV
jgi:hypothetical protein